MTRRRLLLPAVAAALLLAGCGGGDHGAGHGAAAGGTSAAPTSAAFNPADVAFVEGMRPHHEQAIEMSDVVLTTAPPAPVADLARRIQAAQDPEIAELGGLLASYGKGGGEAAGHGGGHGSSGHSAGGSDSSGHGGMMTEQELAAFRAAKGPAAWRMYLELMIRHHEGAVEASRTELAQGASPPAKALAERIASSQTAEIEQMRQLLAQLPPG